MRKWLIATVTALAVVVLGGYVWRDPLMGALAERMTAHMFVARDDDAYDPGIAVGAHVPALRALHRDREIADLDAFMGTRGLALFVNRSVDW